jgi:predicted enzyme related to lactoylglutathione lyase
MTDSDPSPAGRPAIVAPVSRHLSVADVERSLAFYRDVLGFDVRTVPEGDGVPAVAEAVYGPARIQLGGQEGAFNTTGELRPRGSAILFFQTDDVAAMIELIRTRGGAPSDLEKVNWIKMRMFEIRDPDGHRLWFGQSFQQPSSEPDPLRQLRQALPELPLDDVSRGVAYYRDVLGFKVNYAQHDLGVMDRDDITLLLVARTERHTGIGSCYVYVRDADALHAELRARGANLRGEPISHPWGLRDFHVLDLEGNQIRFGQPFE